MPMLHGCAYPGCSTFTLSTYCVEHELLVRAAKESERGHVLTHEDVTSVADTALSAETALTAAAPDPAV
ncbi:MAG: hypothetical protein WAL31_03660 [Gaiellaceae bacterium]